MQQEDEAASLGIRAGEVGKLELIRLTLQVLAAPNFWGPPTVRPALPFVGFGLSGSGAMSLTTQKLVVKESHRSRRKAAVNFLIDSGAVYSLVPAPMLRRLGIRPHRKMEFTLADGTTIKRRVGDAYYEFQGEGGAAPVIFGEAGDEPLLGATTLESLGLVLDPFKRRLIGMRLMPV